MQVLVKLVVRTPRKLAETVSAVLFEAGAGAVEEQDGGKRLVVYAADRETAEGIAARTRQALSEVAPGPKGIAISIEVDESSDWASAWTRHLGQVALTPRLVIQPEWDETPAPVGSQRILFDPKLSFGDGAHATTRLASVALERACRSKPGVTVLDYGSGTGVLAAKDGRKCREDLGLTSGEKAGQDQPLGERSVARQITGAQEQRGRFEVRNDELEGPLELGRG